MAVLKGEGRVPILFGSWALPIPPNRSAYIARPDVAGEHPTVVIAHDDAGITPGLKAIARLLARHGYSVLLPDLTRGAGHADDGFEWSIADLEDAVDAAHLPGTAWASDEAIALLGVGAGALAAAIVAAGSEVPVLVLVGGPLDAELLGEFGGSVLVLRGAEDRSVGGDEVRQLQAEVGRGEWLLYGGASGNFVDDGSVDFDEAAAADALDRIVAHLDRRFGVVVAG